jgi:hypothetical protein
MHLFDHVVVEIIFILIVYILIFQKSVFLYANLLILNCSPIPWLPLKYGPSRLTNKPTKKNVPAVGIKKNSTRTVTS